MLLVFGLEHFTASLRCLALVRFPVSRHSLSVFEMSYEKQSSSWNNATVVENGYPLLAQLDAPVANQHHQTALTDRVAAAITTPTLPLLRAVCLLATDLPCCGDHWTAGRIHAREPCERIQDSSAARASLGW